MRLVATLWLLVSCLNLTVQAQTPEKVITVEGVTQYRLDNGLQVLFLPDPSKGIATVNLTILAGSLQERYGETGMAHLLEHLVFKGSQKFPKPTMEMVRRGLSWNGTTNDDRTNYFASFSSSDETMAWYLNWQADALVNSNIARQDLDSEMTVVRNEFERGENVAERILLERMRSAAFQWHNYGKTVIGARSDIEHVNIERLQDFYRRYYQPDNAVLIVTGRFDVVKTLEHIHSAFGGIAKPTRQLAPLYTQEPVQDGEHQVTVRRTGDTPMVGVLYHAMPAAHPDFAAMALLVSILGAEPQGRLYRQLSSQQFATTSFGWALARREPGAVVFGAKLGAQVSVDAARAAMLKVLDDASNGTQAITQQELEQAKLLINAGFENMLSDPVKISSALSEAAASGDWRLLFLQRDRIENVQLQDLRRVAQRWLLVDNRTVGLYLPTAQPQRAPELAKIDARDQVGNYLGRPALAAAKAFNAELNGLNAKVETFGLANGMKVALLPKESRGGKVRAALTLRYGTPENLAPLRAVSSLALGMLDKGTQDLSRIALAFKALTLGLSDLDVRAGPNFITIAVQGQGDKLADMTPLLTQVLRNPAFAEDEFEKLRAKQIAQWESQRGQPDAMAGNALERLVNPYPETDIRAVPDIDTRITQLKATTLAQVKAFHATYFSASHAELVLVGAFDPVLARQEIDKAFGSWSTSTDYAPIQFQHQARHGLREVLNTPDKKSATYLADLPIEVDESHADVVALQIANFALRKRLRLRVREQAGLSYSVASWLIFHGHDPASHWRIYASFAPQNRAVVESAVDDVLAQFNANGLTPAEVKEAVDEWLERTQQMRSDDKSLAFLINTNLEKNRNFDWQAQQEFQAKGLNAAEVNRVIALYLAPKKWNQVVAGDFGARP